MEERKERNTIETLIKRKHQRALTQWKYYPSQNRNHRAHSVRSLLAGLTYEQRLRVRQRTELKRKKCTPEEMTWWKQKLKKKEIQSREGLIEQSKKKHEMITRVEAQIETHISTKENNRVKEKINIGGKKLNVHKENETMKRKRTIEVDNRGDNQVIAKNITKDVTMNIEQMFNHNINKIELDMRDDKNTYTKNEVTNEESVLKANKTYSNQNVKKKIKSETTQRNGTTVRLAKTPSIVDLTLDTDSDEDEADGKGRSQETDRVNDDICALMQSKKILTLIDPQYSYENLTLRNTDKRLGFNIKKTWSAGNKLICMAEKEGSMVMAKGSNLVLRGYDIQLLQDKRWLNDEVVNYYLQLIQRRAESRGPYPVYCFNTFFYNRVAKLGYSAVELWTKNVNLFDYEYILIPVHRAAHWTLVMVFNKLNIVMVCDSLYAGSIDAARIVANYLNNEAKARGKPESRWKLKSVKDIPRQTNTHDCGVFVCVIAEYLGRAAPATFRSIDIPLLRRRMAWEICMDRLLL